MADKFLRFFLLIGCLILGMPSLVVNAEDQKNYRVIVDDDEGKMFSPKTEHQIVLEAMPIAEHMNVAIKTSKDKTEDVEDFARKYAEKRFGNEDGIVIVFNRKQKDFAIYCTGSVAQKFTRSELLEIKEGAMEDYKQFYYLAALQDILTPIKDKYDSNKIMLSTINYVGNALLAMAIALLINFILISVSSKSRIPADSELLNKIVKETELEEMDVELLDRIEKYISH